MKKILLLVAVMTCSCLMTMAQDELTVDRDKGVETDAALGGKSCVVFVAKTKDLVITTNNPNDAQPVAKKNAKGDYEYSFMIDLSASKERRFNVSRKGTTFKAPPVIKKGLKPNKKLTFQVEGVASWQTYLKLINQKDARDAHFKQDEASLEFTSELTDLVFEVSKNLPYTIEKAKSATGAGVTKILVNTKKLKELEEKNAAAYNEILKNTIKIHGQGTNVVQVPADDIKALGSNVKIPYAVDPAIKTAFKEASFDELIKIAREYYKNYPSHGESSYYDAGRTAYDNALNHKDCPAAEKDAIRVESDTLRSLRRNTFLVEKAQAKAQEIEAQKGFNDPDVFKYLAGAVRFCDRILKYHPEIEAIKVTRNRLMDRVNMHPSSKKEVTETVTRQRKTITGTVSYKNPYLAKSKVNIYATSSEKIGLGESRIIGAANADGTYSVVKPDDMDYIYVSGEKDKAHWVGSDVTTVDILVR